MAEKTILLRVSLDTGFISDKQENENIYFRVNPAPSMTLETRQAARRYEGLDLPNATVVSAPDSNPSSTRTTQVRVPMRTTPRWDM